MDIELFRWFNQWNTEDGAFGLFLRLGQIDYIKTVPFLLVFWALWFWPKTAIERTLIRERLVALILCTIPTMLVTRAAANYLPFRQRPMHAQDIEIVLADWQDRSVLQGWSSMPSDHASLFVGFAFAAMLIHRGFGIFLLLWAIFVVSLPRIVLGYHWPSDIAAGAVIGAALALLLMRPLTNAVRSAQVVPYFEAREALGYPLLFLATYEIARLFYFSRYVILGILE